MTAAEVEQRIVFYYDRSTGMVVAVDALDGVAMASAFTMREALEIAMRKFARLGVVA